MSKSPLVSVVIPLIKINDYLINENLPAFLNQSYKNFEVIILPNNESFEDLKLLKKYKWLKIMPTGQITRPAEKRDIGVKSAKGQIIAFIDDDAYPSPDWLKNAVSLFNSKKVEAVCGPGILPKKTGIWEKIFDEVLKTTIGSGDYKYRFAKQKERYVDDYPSMNFLIQKDTFEKLGGFNSEYWPGEDSKLCNDLVYKNKGKILYDPNIFIYHHRRTNIKSYLKQYANYGFHRGAFFAHGDANSRRLVYLLPTFFVIYLLLIIGAVFAMNFLKLNNIYVTILSLPLFVYFLGSLYIFISSLVSQKNLMIAFMAPIVMFFTHVIYGIIFIKGYNKGKSNPKKIYG